MTISACMIVKDEENNIADCLKTLIDWVDELCVVDTGSKDRTKEIIYNTWTKNLVMVDQEWEEDFSKARNRSIDLATSDIIFIIDADERVIPEHGLTLKKKMDSLDANIYSVDLINFGGKPPKGTHSSKQLRFFARNYNPRYEGKFHNRPVVHGNPKIVTTDFVIKHYGDAAPEDVTKKKLKRRLKMAEVLADEDPNNPWTWFHYARALWSTWDNKFNLKEKDKIGQVLNKGLECFKPGDDGTKPAAYIQLLVLMGTYKHITGNSREAVDYLKESLKYKYDYLDALFMLGMVYTYGVNADEGERWIHRYLWEQKNYKFQDIDTLCLQYAHEREGAYRMLADIARFRDIKQFGGLPDGNIKQGQKDPGNVGK